MTSSGGLFRGLEIMSVSKALSTVPDNNRSYWKPIMKQFLTKLSSSWLLENTQNHGAVGVNLFIQPHVSYSNQTRVHHITEI